MRNTNDSATPVSEVPNRNRPSKVTGSNSLRERAWSGKIMLFPG